MIDAKTGKVYFSKKADLRVPMADSVGRLRVDTTPGRPVCALSGLSSAGRSWARAGGDRQDSSMAELVAGGGDGFGGGGEDATRLV